MKDGFVLFYVKDKEVLPVAMNDDNTEALQMLIPGTFFGMTPKVMINMSQGKAENLLKEQDGE